jgi:hypothetical protein
MRQAEDLDGGALTCAGIKAIASGNPAVMEKVRVDTEIRKLDQLRAAHIHKQHRSFEQRRVTPCSISASATAGRRSGPDSEIGDPPARVSSAAPIRRKSAQVLPRGAGERAEGSARCECISASV